MATCVEDILEELGYSGQFKLNFGGGKTAENGVPEFGNGSAEGKIHELLSKGDVLSADEISARLGLDISEVLAAMLSLELSCAVKKRTDGRWEKNNLTQI